MIHIFRRKYYIYPELQNPFMKFIAFSVLFVTAVQSLLIYFSMRWLEAKTNADISIVVDYRVLGPWKNLLIWSMVLPMIMNFILGWAIMLFVTNKFAGPIFRLENELDKFLAGEKQELKITFREKDYLHKLAQKINQLSRASKTTSE